MASYFKDFLLNIFIIFSPLFLYSYMYKLAANERSYRLWVCILFTLTLILTMSFPVHVNGFTYDFRSIPLTVGSLYGGPAVSLFLYGSLILYRFLMGNPENLLYALSILPSFAFVWFWQRRYFGMKLSQKIGVAVGLNFVIKVIAFLLYLWLTHQQGLLLDNLLVTLQTYLLQALIVGLCVYLVEFLHSYYHMQEEMVKNEKAKIVSEMAASVAHEIRNPLTTVRGFLQLFGSDDIDSAKKQFYQKICLEELDRAQAIITDYLSLAKPDPEMIEKIEINAEITYLSNVLLTYGNFNNIEIRQDFLPDDSLAIVGDRYKFRQALINIGKNAIEALQHGGLLEIRASSSNGQIQIVIRDTGIGMSAEQIKRLGTPYYSTKDRGTGLGTMVSFGILRKMNGKIEIDSELGIGTEYRLTFPLAE